MMKRFYGNNVTNFLKEYFTSRWLCSWLWFWVWYTTQLNTPTPIAKHCLYLLYVYFGKGVREKVEGQQYTSIVPSSMGATVHNLGQKYQPWVNVSSVYKNLLNTCTKSVNRSILKKSRHLGFGVFIVHSSMNVSDGVGEGGGWIEFKGTK